MRINLDIIFVCTGNTCRSPIAQGILKNKLNELGIRDINVISRGIHATENQNASELAIKTTIKFGIDISNHRSSQLIPDEIKHSDLILTMEERHKSVLSALLPQKKDSIFTLGEFSGVNKDVSDPWAMDESYYILCFETIAYMIDRSIDRILTYNT